jgi:hypothetical protein
LIAYVHPRTRSPSLHPCPASDRASSFLLASALLFPPPSLATRRWARRKMRPIDFCHPCVNCVHPHLVRSRITPPLSERGRPADFGIRAACPGDQAFHIAQSASAGRDPTLFWSLAFFPLPEGIASVGVVFPRCRFDRASDIPVASPSSHLCSRPFGRARFHAVDSPPWWRERRLRVDQARRKPPRPP